MNLSLDNATSATGDDVQAPGPLAKAIISLIGAVLISIILFGNCMVLVLIVRFHHLRTPTNYFIMGMAIADFNVGILALVSIIIRLNPHIPIQPVACLLYNFSLAYPSVTSIFTLLFVTLDRYLKVVSPYRYELVVTNKTALTSVVLIYLFSFLTFFVIPFMRRDQVDVDFSIPCFFLLSKVFGPKYIQFLIYIVLIPIGIIAFMYGHLYVVVRRLQKDRKRVYPASFGKKIQFMKQEAKSIKTLTILLGLCISGWVPILSVLLKETYDPEYQGGLIIRTICGYLTFFNSAMNPIWYSLRSEQFRSSAKKLVCGWYDKARHGISVLLH